MSLEQDWIVDDKGVPFSCPETHGELVLTLPSPSGNQRRLSHDGKRRAWDPELISPRALLTSGSAWQRVGVQQGLASLPGRWRGCWMEAMLPPSMGPCCPWPCAEQRRCAPPPIPSVWRIQS